MATDVLSLIDRVTYPVDDQTSPTYRAMVDAAHHQLTTTGAAELSGFITPDGVAALVADAESLAERAFHSVGSGTAFLGSPDTTVDDDHPRARRMSYGVRAVAYDVIPRTSPLRQLYESPEVLALVGDIVRQGTLHPYADPFGALNLAVMGHGDELQWHYDQTDFVVSLAIQAATEGGHFEVVPKLRERSDHHAAGERAVLDGDHREVVTLEMRPGTLLIFGGRTSLHRVSPLAGERLRHVGLLAYDTEPDRVGTEALRHTRYGRTTPFAEPPAQWPIATS